jgi:hypothetical protein
MQRRNDLPCEATRVYPREAQAHIITGITSIINKKYDQALHHLGEYDRLLPGNPEVLFLPGVRPGADGPPPPELRIIILPI